MKKNIVGIIQARMGASRLPNKMMLHLHGYPIVEWVMRRAGEARKLDHLAVAIPDTNQDSVLEWFLGSMGWRVFRGSEMDVLDRFYHVAMATSATHIVRICADNPVICGSEIDHLVDFFFANPCDYAYNHIPKQNSYPDGLGAEMITVELLVRMHREAQLHSQREHVMNYIWDNSEKFIIKTFDPSDPCIRNPRLKLDIDTLDDYWKFLRKPIKMTMSAREIIEVFSKEV